MKPGSIGGAQCGYFGVWLVLSFGVCVERGPIACERCETACARACSRYNIDVGTCGMVLYCTNVMDGCIYVGYDHINNIQMHLWCTRLLSLQERRAIRPPLHVYGPPTAETVRSNKSLCTAPGRSESSVRCTRHLGHPEITLPAGESPHHGYCCGRLPRTNDRSVH